MRERAQDAEGYTVGGPWWLWLLLALGGLALLGVIVLSAA